MNKRLLSYTLAVLLSFGSSIYLIQKYSDKMYKVTQKESSVKQYLNEYDTEIERKLR